MHHEPKNGVMSAASDSHTFMSFTKVATLLGSVVTGTRNRSKRSFPE